MIKKEKLLYARCMKLSIVEDLAEGREESMEKTRRIICRADLTEKTRDRLMPEFGS